MPDYRSDAHRWAAGMGILILAGGAAHAASVTLDFERLPDGTVITAPTVFSAASPVREEFSRLGVHFAIPPGLAANVAGGAILSGPFGVSGFGGSNYLAFNFNPAARYANGQNPQPPQLFNFVQPARLIRVNVGGFGGTARLTAYDSQGGPLAEATVALTRTVAPLEVQASDYDFYSATLRFENSLGGIADDLSLDLQDQTPNQPPVTHADVGGTKGTNDWYLGDVHVTLTAEDSDGTVASTLCRLDGGAWEPYSAPVLVTGEGTHTLEYRSVDNDGAEEAVQSTTLKLDYSAPVVELQLSRWFLWPSNGRKMPVKVQGSAQDSCSGLAGVTFEVNDEYGEVQPPLTRFGEVIVLKAAVKAKDRNGRVYRVSATATDHAGQKRTVTRLVLVPKSWGHCRREYARLLFEVARKR